MIRWLVIGAAAVPGVVAGLVTGASGAATLVAGRPLMLAPRPASLAEAAWHSDPAEVTLRVLLGDDVNRPSLVRIPGEQSLTLTPLEAAVGSEREVMVRLLLDLGARLDDATLHRLRCFVQHYRVGGGMSGYLATRDPSPLSCDGPDPQVNVNRDVPSQLTRAGMNDAGSRPYR